MYKIYQMSAMALVCLGLGLAVVGCGSSTNDQGKMHSGTKMGGEKMEQDKMGGEKTGGGKMGGEKMEKK